MTERASRSVFPGFADLDDGSGAVVADLVARRRERGLSQTEVAARMGTSQSTVARIEAGHSDLRLSTIGRYAAAVEATIGYRVQPAEDRGPVPDRP